MTAATREAQDKVLRAALDLAAAERRLTDARSSVTALRKLEDALAFACADLKEAVDALPLKDRPEGWTA